MPPLNQQIEPGADAGQHDPGLPDPREDLVQAVRPPDRQQVDDRPAVDPDHVLLQQVALDVVDAGHREQVQVAQVEPVQPGRLVELGVEPALVARAPCPRWRDPRRPAGHAGQLDGVMDQGVEPQPAAGARAVGRPRWPGWWGSRPAPAPTLAGLWTTRPGRGAGAVGSARDRDLAGRRCPDAGRRRCRATGRRGCWRRRHRRGLVGDPTLRRPASGGGESRWPTTAFGRRDATRRGRRAGGPARAAPSARRPAARRRGPARRPDGAGAGARRGRQPGPGRPGPRAT